MLARLPWPLPAALAWALCWAVYLLALRLALSPLSAMLLACAVGALACLPARRWWRRALIALGFPLSLALSGTQLLPTWAWLLPMAMLLLVYPLHTWRDAPLFPTPAGALGGLAAVASLAPGAAVLDGGCGLGAGLRALRTVYPRARLHGVECSPLLALACRLRCPWARVWRGDLWAEDWRDYQMVYLFQRPETMARAAAKARAEMLPGTWLVSLAFAVPDLPAHARVDTVAQRPVWVYAIGRDV
ncbi:MAG: class I SAM-dependent methyltransferase [Comamonadaceae bacterium]|nr:class I SAM-dependent methyltransferase [Burkholderiales bacterium]MEB2347825.1 class I SAM-dependent methyltransferase [Comamonadaceae bacterium]